jgi:hypothetical protein
MQSHAPRDLLSSLVKFVVKSSGTRSHCTFCASDPVLSLKFVSPE